MSSPNRAATQMRTRIRTEPESSSTPKVEAEELANYLSAPDDDDDPAPFNNVNVMFESWIIELAAKFRLDRRTFANNLAIIHYNIRFV
jgi:hypothetical protein